MQLSYDILYIDVAHTSPHPKRIIAQEKIMFKDLISKIPLDPKRNISHLPGLYWRNTLIKEGFFILTIFLFLFLILVLLLVFENNSSDGFRLSNEPVERSNAEINRIVEMNDSSFCLRVFYSFEDQNGLEYISDNGINDDSPYCSIKQGESITVRYLSENPNINGIDSQLNAHDYSILEMLIFPFFIMMFFMLFFVPRFKFIYQARRVFIHGLMAEGKIIFVKNIDNDRASQMLGRTGKIYFKFMDQSGVEHEVNTKCDNDWFLNKLTPGMDVTVVYVPSKKLKAMIVECYLR